MDIRHLDLLCEKKSKALNFLRILIVMITYFSVLLFTQVEDSMYELVSDCCRRRACHFKHPCFERAEPSVCLHTNIGNVQ